jgi:tetratricopeptide (TPR) repeat protein
MYLNGSKLRMKKRRRRINPAVIVLFLVSVLAVVYFDQFVITSIPEIQDATPTNTPNPEALQSEGDIFFKEGNFSRAVDIYQQAIYLDPTNTELYLKITKAQLFSGQVELAQTNAENALLLSPNHPDALAMLGRALYFQNNEDEAKFYIEEALTIDGNNVTALSYLAEILADAGDFDPAGEASRKAEELMPTNVDAIGARAYVLWLSGNYEEAIQKYLQALAINNNISETHLALGLVYWANGDLGLAVDEFNKADGLNPGNPLPDHYISQIYVNLGEYAKAVQFAQNAVEDDPGNPFRYGTLGIAEYRMQSNNSAIEAFSIAVHGGVGFDETYVEGIPLSYDSANYFYMYGLALARSYRCGEALPISQALLGGVSGDEIAVYNAFEIQNICSENITDISETPTGENNPDVVETATP